MYYDYVVLRPSSQLVDGASQIQESDVEFAHPEVYLFSVFQLNCDSRILDSNFS